MAKINILRDAMRKYRVGLIGISELDRVFHYVEEGLISYIENFQSFRVRLRKYEKQRLVDYEKLIFKVSEEIQRQNYGSVCNMITEARKIRLEIDESLDSILIFDEANELLRIMKSEIASIWLNKMPTILIFENVLNTAHASMTKGDYVQAKVLIEFCSIKSQNVSSEEVNSKNESGKIIAKINSLKDDFSFTRKYASYLKKETFEIEGRIEIMLHQLIEDGQIRLVKKLVKDLELISANRRSFCKRIKKNPIIVENHQIEIKRALQKENWVGGANAVLSIRNNLLQQKINQAGEQLELAQTGS